MAEHPIVHIEIAAQDPNGVSRFYGDLFGWQLYSLPAMGYVRFEPPSGPGGGFTPVGGPLHHRVGEPLIYVASDDIDGDLRRAEALGGKVLAPRTEIPNTGAFGIFEDPAGNRLGLFQRTGRLTE